MRSVPGQALVTNTGSIKDGHVLGNKGEGKRCLLSHVTALNELRK